MNAAPRKTTKTACGVYVFVPLTPALFASYVAARLAIGGWTPGFAFLGWVLIQTARETAAPSPANVLTGARAAE